MQLNIKSISDDKGSQSAVSMINDNGKAASLGLAKKRISDAAALKQLFEYFPRVHSGLFSPGLRYISADRRIIVFEQPPRYGDVYFTPTDMSRAEAMSARDRAAHNFCHNIPLPWLVYAAALAPDGAPIEIYVFARKTSLASMDEPCQPFPMVNVYPNGRLCRAPQDSNELSFPNTIEGTMASVYYAVWLTGFNHDLSQTLGAARQHGTPKFLAKTNNDVNLMLKIWSQQTLYDVVNAKWPNASFESLHQVIKHLKAYVDGASSPSFFLNRLTASYQSAV